jgi:DeoR/GlpR family transcriptional regulator of sugar metabolism
VTSADYAAKFEISLATARKDLNELIRRGLIRKIGGGRNTRYAAVK